MRALIQDYSSPLSTESKYLTASLQQAQQEVYLWNTESMAAFDVFNKFNPDLFVVHVNNLSEDILKCLSKFNTKVAVNVSNSPLDVKSIEETFHSLGINNFKLFSNQFWTEGVEIILPAFDPFLTVYKQFSIPLGVVTNADLEKAKLIAEKEDVYHLINYDSQLSEGFDFNYRIENVSALSNYEKSEIHLPSELCCSQFFFQATIRANQISIQPTDNQTMFDEFLELTFKPEETSQSVGNVLKKQIAKNHTSFNRAQQLLRLCDFTEAEVYNDIINAIGKDNE
jgi:hypothetical protein